jgi:cytochrome b6
MMEAGDAPHVTTSGGAMRAIKNKLFILEVPSYGNKIFYSLGFLALTCLAILTVTGVIMVFFGSAWWLTSQSGILFRSIHLWAAQAFILLIILHFAVVFLTSGFKPPRRLTWVLGAIVFFFVLAEAEFGYDLRGDFSSQYRALQGADFYNGAYLGKFINTLNYAQVYGIHIIDIPLAIFALLFCHYFLVKTLGIAKPYRDDAKYKMVAADHGKLFLRGGVLAALILLLAFVFPSPLVTPATIGEIAKEDPALMSQTLMQEFGRGSDTATYLDSIDPYAYDTRETYVSAPYGKYIETTGNNDELRIFLNEPPDLQTQQIAGAQDYFTNGIEPKTGMMNPLISTIDSLVQMAKSGLYQSALDDENSDIRPTYSLRFLSDTGVLENEAEQLHMTTEEWGMMREEKVAIPRGAWWLAPIGVLNHTILAHDDNGDRDGAIILGALAMLFIFFPYLPYLNRLPEKLHLAKMIWKTKG